MNERSERGAEGSESNRNRNRSRGRVIRAGRRLKGMEGLQVSFLAGVAEEVGEALLLDAPQDAAHHRRHGCRRHDDSPAGPKRKRGGVVKTGNCGSGRFVRPARLFSSRRPGLPKDECIARWAQLVVGSLKPPSLLLHVGRPIELNKESSQK